MIEEKDEKKIDAEPKSGKSNNSDALRNFGTVRVSGIPQGRHLCQFYFTKKDLIDILVPYFVEGLRNDEFCLWVTSAPLTVEEAKKALRKAVSNLDRHIGNGQIEIIPKARPYLVDGKFDADRLLSVCLHGEEEALRRGFEGVRGTGNTAWVQRSYWTNFIDYEARLNAMIPSHRVTALCTYSLDRCTGTDVLTVLKNHSGGTF